jgi:predicted DNA repair protein MutK
MAAASLLALLDDITSILDDVATMTKVATKKTAGVLGDDLALNAQQVGGVRADRELPVVWAVAKGSLRNKLVLVPAAVAISAFAPWAVAPLLMAGGLYLVYEGVEKLVHHRTARTARDGAGHAEPARATGPPQRDPAAPPGEPAAQERTKIAGAVRTDFVLSAEIIVIALGTVADAPLGTRVAVLAAIGLLMTVFVYGLVAGIVKLDDGGLALARRTGSGALDDLLRALGRGILRAAPWMMRGLSVAGTAAMFLVGGGILVHGLPWLHHPIETAADTVAATAPWAGTVVRALLQAAVGVVAGALALASVALARRGPRGR